MKKLYFFLILTPFLLLSAEAVSQDLNPGDVVIIGYASDAGPNTSFDEFSWVPLVDLPAGTKIYFTDAGYNTIDAGFMGTGQTDEILLRYTAPPGGVVAGTVFTVIQGVLPTDYIAISGTKFGNDGDGIFSFPNAGDQITVFQSTDDENTPATFGNTDFTALFMVAGSTLSFSALSTNQAGIVPATDVDNVTNLSPGLTDGVNAVAVGTGVLQNDESDNARYEGITTGTREEILAAVAQLANWQRYDAFFGNDLVIGDVENGWSANETVLFDIDNLSTQDNSALDFVAYPNPVKDFLHISAPVAKNITKIALFDLSGRLISESQSPYTGMDMSPLQKGVYILNVYWDEHTFSSGKIIRE